MKKILFLLLLSVVMYGQVPADATPLENIQITNNVQDDAATKVTVQDNDGVQNWLPMANLPVSTATENALFSKKDATSTAVTSTATLTNNGSTFTLSPLTGVIVDNSTVPSTRTVINFAGASNVTPLYFRTLLYIDNTGTLQQMNGASTDLTPQQKVDNLFIGIVVYSGGTVQVVQLIPNIEYGIDNRFSVLTDFIRNINEGNNIGANGANLQINKGAGYTFRRGSNFATNREVPDVTTDAAATPIPANPNLIGYRNGSGGWTYEPYTGSLTPQFWDDGSGVKATVANNKFTNQRVYFFNGTNTYVIYLGRTEHATLLAAKTAAKDPDAIVDPATSVGSLIGTVSVANNATALNNTAQADFTQGPRMQGGTGAGGASGSQNMQNTYLNSSVPQITTTALGAFTVQEGTGNDANNVLVGKNNAGTTTFSVSGLGLVDINGNKLYGIPAFSGVNGNDLILGGNPISSSSARFGVSDIITLTDNGHHAFGDYSLIQNTGSTPNLSAYASFDAKSTMTGSIDWNHNVGFQSRNIFQGNNITGYMYGFDAINVHAGSGDVSLYAGLHINNITKPGGGTVSDNYGIKIENITGGTDNTSIWTNGGKLSIGTGTVKADTDSVNIAFLGRTNDVNFRAIQVNYDGNSVLENSAYTVQTIEQGVANGGNIGFQPLGGKAFYKGFTVGNELSIKSDFETLSTFQKVTDYGASTTNDVSVRNLYVFDGGGVFSPSGNNGIVFDDTASTLDFYTGGVLKARLLGGDFGIMGELTATTYTGGAILTGTPTAPTATTGTNTNQIATMAAVANALDGTIGYIPKKTGSGQLGDSRIYESGGVVVVDGDLGVAPLSSGVITGKIFRTATYLVSNLPASPGTNAYATVTDALSPTYLTPVVGGGSVVCPVFYNGTTWVAH